MLPLHTVQDACTGLDGTIYIAGAMGAPPTFVAAFNPEGLPPEVVPDQEAELKPYQLAPEPLRLKDEQLRRKFDDHRQYWITHGTPFVDEGYVMMHDLGLEGYLPLIPENELAITALAMGPDAHLYGVTSGEASHLFVQWTSVRSVRPFDFPIDLGVLTADGQTQTGCQALIAGPDGCIYAGTLNADGSPGHLFRHQPVREIPGQIAEFSFYSPPFDLSPGIQLEDLGVPAEGEGILALVSDEPRGLIYGLGSGGTLFSYKPQSGWFQVLKKLDGPGLSQALLCDPEGNLYGSMGEADLFKYTAEIATLEVLPELCRAGRASAI